MEASLATNWRKEDATSVEEVEATIYRNLVGSLMYLVKTCSYMCYEFNQISQAIINPTKLYWNASKHVLRYLQGMVDFGLRYVKGEGVEL